MAKFYKYDIDDLKELQASGCDATAINLFRDRHFYYTCSCCHKEELYVESPVVKDELWSEAIGNLGIEDNTNDGKLTLYSLPHDRSLWAAVRFYRLFKEINEVIPDESYTMLCRGCMERGLGRELVKGDLVDCDMTRGIIHKFKDSPSE